MRTLSRAPLLVAAALLLAACSGGDDGQALSTPTPPPPPTPSPTATPSPTPTWPLTGLPASEPVDGPVVVVKVDNTASARPQAGLAAADLVVEEVVEGGVTRLAVMLHSGLPSADELVVGPVRSVRSSDVGIVAPTEGVLVASGGAPPPIADLAAAGIPTRFEGSAGFVRDPSRPAPYNLFVDVVSVADSLPSTGAPADYLTWADELDSSAGRPTGQRAGRVVLDFSPAQRTVMDYDRRTETWRRVGDEAGFAASTVIALLLQTRDAGYLDPGGNPVPVLVTEGTGSGYLASGGRLAPIEWRKPRPTAPWSFTTPRGRPVAVLPGTTYLALLPAGTGSVRAEAPAE